MFAEFPLTEMYEGISEAAVEVRYLLMSLTLHYVHLIVFVVTKG